MLHPVLLACVRQLRVGMPDDLYPDDEAVAAEYSLPVRSAIPEGDWAADPFDESYDGITWVGVPDELTAENPVVVRGDQLFVFGVSWATIFFRFSRQRAG